MVWDAIKRFFKNLLNKNVEKEITYKKYEEVKPPVTKETPVIYPDEFGDIVVNGEAKVEILSVTKIILANQERYMAVQDATGVPWKLVAGIHYRESSLDFRGCLHNGDPWNKKTVNVPKGRGPFTSWHESAIDAIILEKNKFPAKWDFAGQMDFAEKFNGLGYRHKGLVSPYVYASTSKYHSGLYTSDGKFSSTKVDKRLGVACIVISLS